jgi:membrane protein YdbS with pleckstrin-like domain
MVNQDIVNYIRAELANNISKEEIVNSLVKVGWGIKDVQDSFDSIYTPSVQPAAPFHSAIGLITEKNYPITTLWVFKAPIFLLFFGIIVLLLGDGDFFWIAVGVYALISNYLIRLNFHYSTEERFFIVREGVFSKNQRNLPYGVIQNIFVKQDIFDRIFGLATLAIENASLGGKGPVVNHRNQQAEAVGSSGNKINIPGLKKEDAEALKVIILQKMKENPVEDNQSGL